MAGLFHADTQYRGSLESGISKNIQCKPDNACRWYFSRKEIEENSPSRRDGIDLKKETYLRKSYCTFLQDLGMRLKVPQVTIATAIIFCHRFFIRQSHAKNDRRTVATVCMFLAGKVEETPRPLKDVILVSYEIINKKDPAASQKIKQKEVYEQQKEMILLGERVVLATLGFDLNVHHPYKPLVEAIKKFQVAQNALAQVAWNFVNDGLRTSLCLQFKPHHIAAGAIFLAAKFLKVKLPSDGEKVWWQEFDVTPRQLEEVSNQMLELYEQNRLPQGSELEAGAPGVPGARAPAKYQASTEEQIPMQIPHRLSNVQSHIQSNDLPARTVQYGEIRSIDSMVTETTGKEDVGAVPASSSQLEHKEEQVKMSQNLYGELLEPRDISVQGKLATAREDLLVRSPKDAIKMIDKDKVKAALEKRKKYRGELVKKKEVVDEEDFIERELEDGVEIAAEDDRVKPDKGYNDTRPKNPNCVLENGDRKHTFFKAPPPRNVEAEMPRRVQDDDSPIRNTRKRKDASPSDVQTPYKRRHNFGFSHNIGTVEP